MRFGEGVAVKDFRDGRAGWTAGEARAVSGGAAGALACEETIRLKSSAGGRKPKPLCFAGG